MRRVIGFVVLLACGCGGLKAQRAEVTAPAATLRPASLPLAVKPTAKLYVVDPSRSRFELFGSDILTGEHRGTFGKWRARVRIEAQPSIDAEVDADSLEVDTPGATPILKRYFLETHRFPLAKLSATLSKTEGGADVHVVFGTAVIHGVERRVKFAGSLAEENGGYRFSTSFIVSRKEFGIRYAPFELFVRDDVRIVIDVYATPIRDDERPKVEEPPPPPAPVPSTWYTPKQG